MSQYDSSIREHEALSVAMETRGYGSSPEYAAGSEYVKKGLDGR